MLHWTKDETKRDERERSKEMKEKTVPWRY